MNKIILPNKCKKCTCVRHYDKGGFERNPHYCCELIWMLFNEDYKVNPEERDKNCPLIKIKNGELKLEEEDT